VLTWPFRIVEGVAELIDPLHTVEGAFAVVGWLIRMCRRPQRRTSKQHDCRSGR